MTGTVYKLQIVDATDPLHPIARFAGKGPVERDLISAISSGVVAKLPEILKALQTKGRWWLRPGSFDQAMQEGLAAAIPVVVDAAIEAVLWEIKVDATAKHFG